jgi:UDP-N-acetylmuramyl pentapeptide phosphotransferase/UDP-N-acetylglucosamine-1-phosphate transferase
MVVTLFGTSIDVRDVHKSKALCPMVLRLFGISSDAASIEIQNSVTTMGAGAFSSCRSLASIVIPNCLTTGVDIPVALLLFFCSSLGGFFDDWSDPTGQHKGMIAAVVLFELHHL